MEMKVPSGAGTTQEEIRKSGMTYQLVLPDEHRRNLAKKATKTWKYHFIGVLFGTASEFPMHLWCQLNPKQKDKYYCCANHTQIQMYSRFPTYTIPRTTALNFLFHWEWKPRSMRNPIVGKRLHHTVSRNMFWAPPPQTISLLEIVVEGNTHTRNIRESLFQKIYI